MAKVLLLFVRSDEQESKRMRDCLQTNLGTSANIMTVKEALANKSCLKNELIQSRCVILVSSKQSSEFIVKGMDEKVGHYIVFDGNLIHQALENGDLLEKLVVVQFGSAVSNSQVPDGYDRKVFLLNDNFSATDPVLKEVEDTVKGLLTTKVKESAGKMKKKTCSLL